MSNLKHDSHVVSVRLSTEEWTSLAALAAIEGKSASAYIRGLLAGAKARPRPILAAAGELLAICASLSEAMGKLGLSDDARAVIEQQARRVITIMRLHDRDAQS